MKIKVFIIGLMLILVSKASFCQDTIPNFKNRKVMLGITSSVLTTGSLLYLNQAWYQEYNTGSFHFFNDNNEWLQMDKCGHFFTTYQTGRLMMDAMNWAGYNTNKQILIGGLSGFYYMLAIEVMDGYSNGWGFSWGDIAANTLGSGFVVGQKMIWKEQRAQIKLSFLPSQYATYNPKLLGNNLPQQVLKDYNGQTYWLSVNPASFIKRENNFPKWLNIAFGYGANGMIGATFNPDNLVDKDGNKLSIKRYNQYYFSLDVDLTKIKTKSKFVNSIFRCVNILKFPFPTVEFSQGNIKFNPY